MGQSSCSSPSTKELHAHINSRLMISILSFVTFHLLFPIDNLTHVLIVLSAHTVPKGSFRLVACHGKVAVSYKKLLFSAAGSQIVRKGLKARSYKS